MPALTADISAAIRRARIETFESATIKARYPSARDDSGSPAEGFFDSAANALTAAQARGALLGVERRRFAVRAADIVNLTPNLGVPTVTLKDAEQGVDGAFLVARIELSLEDETTTFEVFG